MIVFNNLGGLGPDLSHPESIRITNVGAHLDLEGIVQYFDLEITNQSTYTSASPQSNGLSGALVNISVACNTHATLRTEIKRSCNTLHNCGECERSATTAERDSCFLRGCSCFGAVINNRYDCYGGDNYNQRRAAYSCAQMDQGVISPSNELITMSFYDLDGEMNSVRSQ